MSRGAVAGVRGCGRLAPEESDRRRDEPMTGVEWLACYRQELMLEFLHGKDSDRKRCLFACACCRRVWHRLTTEADRRVVEVMEQSVEGQATVQDVSDAAV